MLELTCLVLPMLQFISTMQPLSSCAPEYDSNNLKRHCSNHILVPAASDVLAAFGSLTYSR